MARYNEKSHDGRSIRVLRVGEQVRQALSAILSRDGIHDDILSSANIAITEVRMSPDLRNATVFFKPLLGDDEEAVHQALKRHVRYLRGEVSRSVRMKYACSLKFLPDHSFDESSHITQLLNNPHVAQDIADDEADDTAEGEEEA